MLDWGLNLPFDFALQSWEMLRQHGILPDSGGLLDQDPDWLADMRTLNARYNAAVRESGKDGDLDDLVGENPPGLEDLF